ncbi:uncharacterized protein YggE [Metabacillus crassostreae]|uniref:SIMPL domain-containing protein n=1 Tax=Metabacillus crassostreae TaxID=929098 RepID=UPI00195769BD|nr:SIMPL domain-containing protein [Metabacillus crassostreae]MBM7602273.1 uncharacterized protein YggE [Metabacillus crassostreae]
MAIRPYYLKSSLPFNDKHHKGKLTVEGKGIITTKPDKSSITLGIITEDQDVIKAQNKNSIITNNVIISLRKSGISNNQIQTISYTIQPLYQYVDEQNVLTGYKISHILEVTLFDLDLIGEVYKVAVSSGANIAEGLKFSLSNENYYYDKALKKALKQATLKAISLGQQMGVTINTIPIKITENSSPQPLRDVMYSFTAETNLHDTPPIQQRDISIEANLTAEYYY